MGRVAFIGLGTMGLPMARRLAAAGWELAGFDLETARATELHAETPISAAAAAIGADAVLVSLPSPAAVRAVADEVRPAMRRGALFIDLSTSPPALAREQAALFRAAGLAALDAPVSGGPVGAAAGTLTVMVGGEEAAFAQGRPLLELFGRPYHVGGDGAGQTAKLANNLIAGTTMAALAEACALAAAAGIEPALLYELLTTSTGDSRVLRTRFPLSGADERHPSANDFAPLFALDLIAKDLALALELRNAPVATAALAAYRRAQEAGLGELDYSAVYLTARE